MTIRVLVVDDSRFICARIKEALEEDAEFSVIGVARNGREAVTMAAALEPDVITMDVDMPEMDGIEAVRRIMSSTPCPILMFSAMTHVGAQATWNALNAGAIDFLPKQLQDIDSDRLAAKAMLRFRVRMVAKEADRLRARCRLPLNTEAGSVVKNRNYPTPAGSAWLRQNAGCSPNADLLVIAASTGGPVAIQQILTQIPAACRIPVLLVQHMPQNFTKSFAERLDQLCQIRVAEANNGDLLQAGTALLAPGGMQLQLKNYAGGLQIVLTAKQASELYSPCVDITFTSLAEQFAGKVLAIVLTGMGSDGAKGAAKLKQKGAEIWAQDEASCTVYGMPKAVADARLADKIYSLNDIANALKKLN